MKLNQEQILSFNRLLTGVVANNKYMSKGLSRYNNLIVFTPDQKLVFNLNEFDHAYQTKFINNNLELYCTSLFMAIQPMLALFLKNEGMTAATFQSVFLCGDKRVDSIEMVNVRHLS